MHLARDSRAGRPCHAFKLTHYPIETSIAFARDDGQLVTVRGAFGVFTEGERADLSVLGRDVTNNFSVIYDYSNQVIALLAPPHSYEIKPSS